MLLAKYKPGSSGEAEDLIEHVIPYRKHNDPEVIIVDRDLHEELGHTLLTVDHADH
jgi:hypothetical protein